MSGDFSSFFPGADVFSRVWSDFASQMMRSGMGMSPGKTTPEVAREARTAMFKAWNDYCDQFLRTPEFIEMMKQSLAGSIQARKQLNDSLGQIQHEVQGASRQDVDQLMLSLRHMERRLVDTMERMSDQLDRFQERLQTLERRIARSQPRPGGVSKKRDEDKPPARRERGQS